MSGQTLADVLAAEIRRVDGAHRMGAGAIGEALEIVAREWFGALLDESYQAVTGEIYEALSTYRSDVTPAILFDVIAMTLKERAGVTS